jgi:hypothetical protein
MQISIENSSFSRLRLGKYVIEGDDDLLCTKFLDLGILRHQQMFNFNHVYLAGKLLTNSRDEYHMCSSVLPVSVLDELCNDALKEETIEVRIAFCNIS